jgi:hypothetical protein
MVNPAFSQMTGCSKRKLSVNHAFNSGRQDPAFYRHPGIPSWRKVWREIINRRKDAACTETNYHLSSIKMGRLLISFHQRTLLNIKAEQALIKSERQYRPDIASLHRVATNPQEVIEDIPDWRTYTDRPPRKLGLINALPTDQERVAIWLRAVQAKSTMIPSIG